MARVKDLIGFETRSLSAETAGGSVAGSGVTLDTSTGHSGSASLKLAAVSATTGYWNSLSGTTSGWVSFYVRFTALPATARSFMGDPGLSVGGLTIDSTGTVRLKKGVSDLITSSATLTDTARWYLVEVKTTASVCALWIDGVQQGSDVSDTSNAIQLRWGTTDTVAATFTAYYDDIICDDTNRPGAHSLALLLPTSDNSAGSWTAGSGASKVSNGALFNAIDNTPPVGTTSPDAATACISNAVSGATAPNGDFNMTTYTVAGVGASDTVNAVQQVIAHGEDVSTGVKTGTFKIFSNPDSGTADTITQFGPAAGGAVGTYASNWATSRGTIVQAPSVTKGTAPVARITKTDTGTRDADCCFLGMYVDYTPSAGPPPFMPEANFPRWQAVNRAATR